MTANRPELVSVAVADRGAGGSVRVKVEARKPPGDFANGIVERSRKPQRRQVHSILTFRRVRTADEAIETIPEIQHGTGTERVNLVHHRLFRNKEKAVAEINGSAVVVISALPVVPAIAPEQLVLFANVLVEPDRVVPVWRIECFSKRRISDVVVKKLSAWSCLLGRTHIGCH